MRDRGDLLRSRKREASTSAAKSFTTQSSPTKPSLAITVISNTLFPGDRAKLTSSSGIAPAPKSGKTDGTAAKATRTYFYGATTPSGSGTARASAVQTGPVSLRRTLHPIFPTTPISPPGILDLDTSNGGLTCSSQ